MKWRSRVRRLGLGMVVAGLAMLGWVGWQFYGTNWVSHRHQEQVVSQLRVDWEHGEDATQVGESRATAVVRIPRFGPGYAVPLLEGTSDQALATGFGHFSGTADPGGRGNFAIAAHRVTHGEPLRGMPELRAGDEVVIETRTSTYTYVLDTAGDDLVVPFTSGWVVDPEPRNPDVDGVGPSGAPRLITVATCAELFHTDDRMVAFGHLDSVSRAP
ncbi:putative integral membrane protein [metagenome]|uniref:Putative integral membrane protein n=1 Tax=metagenome TaxID=256318 RepID=A0A2P2C1A6_9ZZZZ